MNLHKKSQKEYYSMNFKNCDSNVTFMDPYRFDKVYSMISNEKIGSILDIGCLSGTFLLKLKNIGWKCAGIEFSDACIEGKQSGLDILKHDVEEGIPYESELFDVVFAGELIEHIVDTDAFVKEVYRIIKKNGKFILTTPNIASLINRILLLFGKYPRYLEYKTGEAGHIHLYNLEKLKEQLEKNGFSIETVKGNYISFPDPTPNKIIRKKLLVYLGNFLPTLSENLIIMAKRM